MQAARRARAPRSPGRARWRARGRARARSRAARCRRAPPAPRRCSFSRGRSCGATVFIVHHTLLYFRAMRRLPALLCMILLGHAGAPNPPTKKSITHRARSTPRAPPAPTSTRPRRSPPPTSALQQSHEAVDQRDYRLALSRASTPTSAPRTPPSWPPTARRRRAATPRWSSSAVNAAAIALDARLKAAEAARVPARALIEPRRTAKDAAASLQKARAIAEELEPTWTPSRA